MQVPITQPFQMAAGCASPLVCLMLKSIVGTVSSKSWMSSSKVKLLNLPLKVKRSIQLQNFMSFVTDAIVGNFFSCYKGPSLGQFSVDHIL